MCLVGAAERSGELAESRIIPLPPFGRTTKAPLSSSGIVHQTRGIVGLAEELSPYLGTDTQLRAAGCIVAVSVRSPIQRCPRSTLGPFVPSRTYQVARLSSGLVDTRATPDFPASEGGILFIQAATALCAISCRAWLTHRVRLVGDDKLNADPRTLPASVVVKAVALGYRGFRTITKYVA